MMHFVLAKRKKPKRRRRRVLLLLIHFGFVFMMLRYTAWKFTFQVLPKIF
jgi:cell division protein FtsB